MRTVKTGFMQQADGYQGDPGDEDTADAQVYVDANYSPSFNRSRRTGDVILDNDTNELTEDEIQAGTEFLSSLNRLVDATDASFDENDDLIIEIAEYTLGDAENTRTIPLANVQAHFAVAADMIDSLDNSLAVAIKRNNILNKALIKAVEDAKATSCATIADYILEAITEGDE